ncbi:hypothetical protein NKH73_25185 [Mesorhizobium sp. M0938]|uniref:hypothetical protein n=1 Tax=unclassified Mesorhizobium TaxID=325217 RepID=UPI003337DF5C
MTGLLVKFSTAIAEIVRAGHPVGRPQPMGGVEGARSAQWLGHALIVLPRALRVITPLTTSSHLDLTKDSSLVVAIG